MMWHIETKRVKHEFYTAFIEFNLKINSKKLFILS